MSEGMYTFKWSHPAQDVVVTGSFDDWKETVKMTKGEDDVFTATVKIPKEKTTYKFVVDKQWTTDASQKNETDASGNINNYLLPGDILAEGDAPVQPFVQSAAPTSTTAALAGAVPLESEKKEEDKKEVPADIPDTSGGAAISSVAPTSTTAALAGAVPLESETKPASAIPAGIVSDEQPTPGGKDVPGGFPDTPANELTENQTVKIDPLPASSTATNPINLAPGEPVPKDISGAGINDNVKLDKESYEKADASNLGTTAAAGMAAVTGAVASAYASVTGSGSGEKAAEGDAKAAPADNNIHLPETARNLIPESVLPISVPGLGVIQTKEDEANTATTDTVPEVVKDSQVKAGQAPEASAVPEAVVAKKAFEDEVVKEVEKAPATAVSDGSANKTDVPEVVQESQAEAGVLPEASAVPAAVEAKKEVEQQLTKEVAEAPAVVPGAKDEGSIAPGVPAVVKQSIEKAEASPEGAAIPTTVEAKKSVEEEIAKTQKPTEPAAQPPADKVTEDTTAKPSETSTATPAKDTPAEDTPAKDTPAKDTPAKDTVASSSQSHTDSAQGDKKKKRLSRLFGKIKDALK